MAWCVDSNAEYRTDPKKLVRSREITKHFLIRSNSVRRSLLLTPQKPRQNKRQQSEANRRVNIMSCAIQP